MRDNTDYDHRILEALSSQSVLTQRALASRLGIALGSTNQRLRQLMARGWIRGVRGGAGVRYVVTPQGEEALAGMTRENLRRALVSYGAVLERVRRALAACQARPRQGNGSGTVHGNAMAWAWPAVTARGTTTWYLTGALGADGAIHGTLRHGPLKRDFIARRPALG